MTEQKITQYQQNITLKEKKIRHCLKKILHYHLLEIYKGNAIWQMMKEAIKTQKKTLAKVSTISKNE